MSEGQRNLVDPALIPGLILEYHHKGGYERCFGIQAYLDYGPVTCDLANSTDDESWKIMLESGLTSALLECVLDNYLFGFTIDELIDSPANTERCLVIGHMFILR